MQSRLRELFDELRVHYSVSRSQASGSTNDPLVLKLIDLTFFCAVQAKASDIHIEPSREGARIRYRIDGMLHEMLRLPSEISDSLIRAVKVKASFSNDAVGRSKPQDGRIDTEIEGRKFDFRVASFPTLFGDVLALRVLERAASLLNMDELGCSPGVLKYFKSLIKRPNGLILVTGPGGSGKTTTLYAALNALRSAHTKIVTLEDPVEYQVEEIAQSQINPAVGVTFASGLRAALRQDANIILVGEIRDKETAEIAVRAALTGHLVFSTIHTRHSVGALVRLLDMGVEMHMILASLVGVMAQRLVRQVCPACAKPDSVSEAAAARLWQREAGAQPPPGMFAGLRRGSGCKACSGTGFSGRVGIFELLVVTEEFRRLLFENTTSQLYRIAVTSGHLSTMLLDGLEKAGKGLTTVEEVLRVTGEEEDLVA